jgi:hypothetical protein
LPILGDLDLMLEFSNLNDDWKFGLMVRDITTTYNIWNIDEEKYQEIKDAIPGENQELPESTSEITFQKHNWECQKNG